MSQKEMDRMDQECENMVNSAATPEAMAAAEAIAEEWYEETGNGPHTEPDPFCGIEKSESISERYKRQEMAAVRKEKNQRRTCLVLRIALCLLIAAFFVAVLVEPALVIWLVNVGVLCCGIVAAIAIDRHCRR